MRFPAPTPKQDLISRDVEILGPLWGSMLALGIGMVVLGLIAIALPLLMALTLEIVLGTILVAAGVGQGMLVMQARLWRGFLIKFCLTLLYLFIGGLMLIYPMEGVLSLTLVLMGLFLAEGLFKLSLAFVLRPQLNWQWVLVSALVTLFLAGLIWAQLPSSANWAVGLLFGVNLLFWGGWLMLAAFRVRQGAPGPH